jgi:hypothetical protein
MIPIFANLIGLILSLVALLSLVVPDPSGELIPVAATTGKIIAVVAIAAMVLAARTWTKRVSTVFSILAVAGVTVVAMALTGDPWRGYVALGFELLLISSTVYFTHSLLQWLCAVEGEMRSIMLAKDPRVISLAGELNEVSKQIYMSRRSGKPLSLVLLDMKGKTSQDLLNRWHHQLLKEIAAEYLRVRTISEVLKGLRRSDYVAIQSADASRLYLVCPETSATACGTLMERIRADVVPNLKVPVGLGAATFPDSALSVDGLIGAAESDLASASSDVPRIGVAQTAVAEPAAAVDAPGAATPARLTVASEGRS